MDVDPKLSPLIVTLPPPVSAPFSTALLTAGASNVKIVTDDPTKFATLSMMPPFMNTVGAVKHATVVRAVQNVVVHTFCETDADAVSSEYPKLSPLIVTGVLALTARFARSKLLMLTTGAERSRQHVLTQHIPALARPNTIALVSGVGLHTVEAELPR